MGGREGRSAWMQVHTHQYRLPAARQPACLPLSSQSCPHLNCDSIHLVQSANCSLTKGTEWLRSGRPLR
jgi:hypothetical protein